MFRNGDARVDEIDRTVGVAILKDDAWLEQRRQRRRDRNVLIASRFRSRQPEPGSTPGGKSPVSVSLFRSPSELEGENGRLERKSPMTDTCESSGSCAIPLTTRRWRRSAAPARRTF